MTAPYRISRAIEVFAKNRSGVELGQAADIKGIYYYEDDVEDDSPTPSWTHELEIRFKIQMQGGVFYIERDGQVLLHTLENSYFEDRPVPESLTLYTRSNDATTLNLRLHKDPSLRKFPQYLRVKTAFNCIFEGIYQREVAARHGKISYFSLCNIFHIHWSRRRERWELSAPQWPGMITIHGECQINSSSPVSDTWVEHGSNRTFEVAAVEENDPEYPQEVELKNIDTYFQDPSPYKAALNIFWRSDKRTQEFANLSWVQKLHHEKMTERIQSSNELRLIVGIPENHLASLLKQMLPEYLAVCASEFCGPQIATLCLTGSKIRIVCGWSYEKFESNFDIDLQKVLWEISYRCNWHQDLQTMVSNRRNAWVLL